MKKNFTILVLLVAFSMSSALAQIVVSQGIISTNVDLANTTTLGQVDISPTSAGKIIVRFDGTCIADVGDRILLAASNTTNYGANDGCVSIEATDADVNRKPFSHTRVYTVTAGTYTYYALAHNYVELDGSGIASTYGTLTAEFIPDGTSIVEFQGISQTNVDLANATALGQITINPTVAGKVIVSFDGKCISDVGDRIVLAANDAITTGINDGSVGVEAVDTDINTNCFSHTRVYTVTPGTYTYYAVGHNYVETAGTGIASVYGSLTVKFIPDGTSSLVGFQGISSSSVDLANVTTLGQVTIDPITDGKAIVRFDGRCISDVGDRIVVAASNTTNWTSSDGNVNMEVPNTDNNSNSFSHTRVYDITAGSHTFNAVAQNYVELDGSGIASIYGSLTVEFISNSMVSIESYTNENALSVFPNPTSDEVFININDNGNGTNICTVYNIAGKQCLSAELQGNGLDKLDVSQLSAGMYYLSVTNNKTAYYAKFMKN